jgi:hypothetical protein
VSVAFLLTWPAAFSRWYTTYLMSNFNHLFIPKLFTNCRRTWAVIYHVLIIYAY